MTVRLKEWDKNETGWTWIEVTPNKVINLVLRSEDNLIQVNSDNEIYTDLQLASWLTPSSTFPVWITTGRVLKANWRPVTWTITVSKTTSWDYHAYLYWDNKDIYVDNWTWIWRILAYKYLAWVWIEISSWDDYSAMQWPCPSGYHIPTSSEWTELITALTTLGLDSSDTSSVDTYFGSYLKMPAADGLNGLSWQRTTEAERWVYWSSDAKENAYWRFVSPAMFFYGSNRPSGVVETREIWVCGGYSIRAKKDIPVIPSQDWSVLLNWNGIAANAWIYYNSNIGLISISADGLNRITIADKNLWATTVYNLWDTKAESNCWKYFQRWNNYMFPYAWTNNTSTTLVDATWYWPWNYYSSDTFVCVTDVLGDNSWNAEPRNFNLRWWETWVLEYPDVISNTWVLSVNGQAWHVIINQPWVVEIEISEDGNGDARGNITWWTLIDGSVVIATVDNLTTITDITSFYLSTDEVELVPWIANITNGDVFTWMYKEQNGTKGIFVWQKWTPTP